jgi:hypothetical protein
MGTNRGTSWWLGSTTCRTYSISRRPECLETGIAGTLSSRNTWHWKISPLFGGLYHRIGWRENLQETPIFDGKNHGFL